MIAQHTPIIKVFCKAMFDFNWKKGKYTLHFKLKAYTQARKYGYPYRETSHFHYTIPKKTKETKTGFEAFLKFQ